MKLHNRIMKLENRFLESKNGFRYLIIEFWKAKINIAKQKWILESKNEL